ncbi:MAG: 50S ribosomal protein L23 [Flavobacteriaceae bacterium]|jgi:large subunit ribosomal protein L23|nr:50S ribosomal protein L23 [Flavobacteriaceae bacterium]MBJ33270.1 50S ribosomal protein L23 [Flavobacteriaceae bacterium]|tara:strand:- start:288 stop:578 length:291 start_codon:yes stop_codon:yes gene_type:complete
MRILLKPVITEKATRESELKNRYTFLVDPKANKIEIKKAVEATYGVNVEKVRTLSYGPERRSRYTKNGIQHSKTNVTKRAVVEVAEGENIDFYSNL